MNVTVELLDIDGEVLHRGPGVWVDEGRRATLRFDAPPAEITLLAWRMRILAPDGAVVHDHLTPLAGAAQATTAHAVDRARRPRLFLVSTDDVFVGEDSGCLQAWLTCSDGRWRLWSLDVSRAPGSMQQITEVS